MTATATHYSKGKMVATHVNVPPPQPMTCIRLSCYLDYVKRVLHYMTVLEYHKRRMRYAEKHKDKDIPEHYRTGDPLPNHLTWEIIKLSWR